MCRIRRCGSMPVALSRSFFDESADKTAVIPVLCRRRIRRYLCRCSWNNRHRFLQCLYNLGYRYKYFHSRRGMFWFRCRLSTLRCRSVHCRRRNRPDYKSSSGRSFHHRCSAGMTNTRLFRCRNSIRSPQALILCRSSDTWLYFPLNRCCSVRDHRRTEGKKSVGCLKSGCHPNFPVISGQPLFCALFLNQYSSAGARLFFHDSPSLLPVSFLRHFPWHSLLPHPVL